MLSASRPRQAAQGMLILLGGLGSLLQGWPSHRCLKRRPHGPDAEQIEARIGIPTLGIILRTALPNWLPRGGALRGAIAKP